MICFHKDHNWSVAHRDGRVIEVVAKSYYFAREKACVLLQCEHEHIASVTEQETKKESK